MRPLIVAAAALLAVGVASPTLAAPAVTLDSRPAADTQTSIQLAAPVPLVQATKKKKKKKSESASITEIGNARRGKSDLEIKASVSKSGRDCNLSVKWKDGSTSEDDAESKEDKICEFSISVPSSSGVVGEATASLTVKDASGKKVASAKKTFTVK